MNISLELSYNSLDVVLMISESQLNREKEIKIEPSNGFEKTGGEPPVKSEMVTSATFVSPHVQTSLVEAELNH